MGKMYFFTMNESSGIFSIIYIDESFTPENIRKVLSKTMNEEQILSLMYAKAHEFRLEDCIKSHPCLSWSVLISMLLQAKEKDAANYILQNHEFHVKGTVRFKPFNYVFGIVILYLNKTITKKHHGKNILCTDCHIHNVSGLRF